MRGSKYNDYRVFYAVIAVIVLVVLGLLIYKNLNTHLEHEPLNDIWITVEEATCTADGQKCRVCSECGERFDYEPIPATGHTEASPVEENRVSSTCTKGGSYETVVYCRDCDYEFSRNTVQVEMLPHTRGEVKQEDVVDPTHTIAGSYNDVVRCTECDIVLESEAKVIDPIGHNELVWHAEYTTLLEGDKPQIYLFGECSCKEYISILTAESEGVTITKINSNIASCCENSHRVTYEYNGKLQEFEIELPLESHKIAQLPALDIDNNTIIASKPIDSFIIKVHGIELYDYDAIMAFYGTLGSEEQGYVYHDILLDGEGWNDNGIGIALFRCIGCENVNCQFEIGDSHCADAENHCYHAIQIYSKEYDKTATPES